MKSKVMDTKLKKSKYKQGKDYFLWVGEKYLGSETYRHRLIRFFKSPQPTMGEDPLGVFYKFGWACNIYGEPFGDYIAVSEELDNPVDNIFLSEIKPLLLEQAQDIINTVLFDVQLTLKARYLDKIVNDASRLMHTRSMGWRHALEQAFVADEEKTLHDLHNIINKLHNEGSSYI